LALDNLTAICFGERVMKKIRLFYLFIFTQVVLVLLVPGLLIGAETVLIGDFSSGILTGWEEKIFKGLTDYKLVRIDNKLALRAQSRSSASGLVKKIRIDLQKYPYLNWSWKIEKGLPAMDEKSKAGDDYCARVYVIASDGLFFWNTKAINYVWSAGSKKGEIWPNAFAGKNAMMKAIRSREDEMSVWYEEQRNIYRDFKEIHGKEIRFIDAVAIMTDTDNSNGKAVAWYGNIYFSSAAMGIQK